MGQAASAKLRPTLQPVPDTGGSPAEGRNRDAPDLRFFKKSCLCTLWFNLATAVLEISIQEKVKEQGQRSKEKNGRKEVVYVGKRAPHRVSRSW